MRKEIWKIAVGKHPQGTIMPRRLLVLRAVLYPLKTFYWKMNQSNGYQVNIDIWIIDGVKYSGVMLRAMAEAQGETYKMTRNGEIITLERV
ncbi:MAG: hypothetical protein JKY67_00855 [Pseudomonadales bacterium]|nr:hypothetical protein [Pseudomonadales bacterium]